MIKGSIVAIITPFTQAGVVDYPALKRLVDFHVENGTNAIVSVGTTGESPTLDFDEHCEVIARTVEYAAGRIPVIGGTGANSTSEAIQLTRCAAEARVDACLLVVPYYNKPTQEGLYLHFKAIAEAVPVPQILYNVPGRTACDLKNETALRLAAVDNIIGIKDATGDLARGRELIERCGPDFAVYSGDDATALDLMLSGGKGDISVTANIAPRLMSEMCRAALAGDAGGARAINTRLMPLHKNLFVEANPIPVKWAATQLGLCGGHIRLPLTPLTAEGQRAVGEAMHQAGIM
jgi:4-hydroxy-tetrahydrodipicolinate synthase